jgi:hypothetical protein
MESLESFTNGVKEDDRATHWQTDPKSSAIKQ